MRSFGRVRPPPPLWLGAVVIWDRTRSCSAHGGRAGCGWRQGCVWAARLAGWEWAEVSDVTDKVCRVSLSSAQPCLQLGLRDQNLGRPHEEIVAALRRALRGAVSSALATPAARPPSHAFDLSVTGMLLVFPGDHGARISCEWRLHAVLFLRFQAEDVTPLHAHVASRPAHIQPHANPPIAVAPPALLLGGIWWKVAHSLRSVGTRDQWRLAASRPMALISRRCAPTQQSCAPLPWICMRSPPPQLLWRAGWGRSTSPRVEDEFRSASACGPCGDRSLHIRAEYRFLPGPSDGTRGTRGTRGGCNRGGCTRRAPGFCECCTTGKRKAASATKQTSATLSKEGYRRAASAAAAIATTSSTERVDRGGDFGGSEQARRHTEPSRRPVRRTCPDCRPARTAPHCVRGQGRQDARCPQPPATAACTHYLAPRNLFPICDPSLSLVAGRYSSSAFREPADHAAASA